MAESMANRVGRIVAGSVNSLIDALEGVAPESVMQQAIREIDEAIDEVRSELGRVLASKHLSNKRLAEKSARHDDLGEQIAVALEGEREDLARAGVSEQLDIEAQIPVLEQAIAEASEREKELEGYLSALQAKRREMEKELQDFIKSQQSAAGTGGGGDHLSPGGGASTLDGKVDKASTAFDRLMQKHGGAPTAGGGFDGANKAKVQELERLSRDHRIEERLAALKSQ